VIERDMGHGGDHGLDHVGAVEPPAEPDLDHGISTPRAAKSANASAVPTSKNVASLLSMVGTKELDPCGDGLLGDREDR
jgi:hypothetical protein